MKVDNPSVAAPSVECSRSAFLASLVAIPVAAVAAARAEPAAAATTTTSTSSPTTAQQESISGFVAGAALAATKTVVKYPLDTATVRLQMPHSTYTLRNLPELFRGSYRGVVSPLLANIPAGAVFFAVKDAVKASLMSNNNISNRWLTTALAVGVAQFPYWAVRNPSEVVKTRQQAGLAGYDEGVGAWEAYLRVRDESRIQQQQQQQQQASSNNNNTIAALPPQLSPLAGIDAFYTGYVENILYAYPADVIKFVAYEQLTGGRKNLPPAQGALAGAAATALAQLLTTPLDVVRNRIMAETTTTTTSSGNDNGRGEPTATSAPQRLSYTERLVQLAREEGLAGLFAGATPRVGKAIVSGAIQFATYEETKLELAKLFQAQQQQSSEKGQ